MKFSTTVAKADPKEVRLVDMDEGVLYRVVRSGGFSVPGLPGHVISVTHVENKVVVHNFNRGKIAGIFARTSDTALHTAGIPLTSGESITLTQE